MTKGKKFAIVGASIAGCSTAIFLKRAGFDVTIYESRPKGLLDDRGAGIAMPKDLVKKLISLDVLDKNFPIINVDDRIFIAHDPYNDEERVLTVKPFRASAVHWGTLYTNLAKRMPDQQTFYDTKVVAVNRAPNNKVRLTLSNQEQVEFDYVIFADGFNSIGRQFLFPTSRPNYSGYIAWRGILFRMDDDLSQRLKNSVPFYLYEKGHLLIYAIPLKNARDTEREYSINWLIYENIDVNHPLYKDNNETANLPANAMKPEYLDYLHHLVAQYFPQFARDIVYQTEKPFTQAIYDAYVPQYFENNIALVGDASILVRPHVGAGSTKAIEDALALNFHLGKQDNIRSAMENWSVERHRDGKDLLTLCQTLGELFVSHVPNLDKMNRGRLDHIWKDIVRGHDNWYQIAKK